MGDVDWEFLSFLVNLFLIAEVIVGIWFVIGACRDRRAMCVLHMFERLRDPALKDAIRIVMLGDKPQQVTIPGVGPSPLSSMALVASLKQPQSASKAHQWIHASLDPLFDVADECQGLIELGFLRRTDCYAFQPYFQVLAKNKTETIEYLHQTRPYSTRAIKYIEATAIEQ